MPLGKDREITTKGARGLFLKNFVTRRRKLTYTKVCAVVPSHVENDFARAIGTVPQLEEVIDSTSLPPLSDFRDYAWDWKNRLYRAAIQVERSLFDFSQTKQELTLLDSLAARVANFPDLLLYTRLINDSLYGGDGVKLFSASHPAPIGSSTTQSNIVTGTTAVDFCFAADVPEVATQILTDFRNAKARMRRFLDDNGQPWHDDDLNSEDFLIICSPLLEAPMRQAFFSQTIAATDNILKSSIRDIIVSNYLPGESGNANASDWYLVNVGTLSRPFQYSSFRRIKDEELEDQYNDNREEYSVAGVDLESLKEFSSIRIETNLGHQGMNAEADVMLNDRITMQARWRGEIFGGEWRNAIRVDNTAT